MREGFLPGLSSWLVGGHLFPVSIHHLPSICVQVSSPYKEAIIRTHHDSLCKDTISKISGEHEHNRFNFTAQKQAKLWCLVNIHVCQNYKEKHVENIDNCIFSCKVKLRSRKETKGCWHVLLLDLVMVAETFSV